MRHNSERMIKVKKIDLINKIKESKEKHQKEFAQAVEDFKVEAAEQLKKASDALAAGEYKDVKLNITTPVDQSAEYDKLVEMFQWEVEDVVELSQDEFNEYIFDETSFAKMARMSNVAYLGKSRGR